MLLLYQSFARSWEEFFSPSFSSWCLLEKRSPSPVSSTSLCSLFSFLLTFPLIKPLAGLSWPSRQLSAGGSIWRPGLLREICWLTGNDTLLRAWTPLGLAVCFSCPPACLPSLGPRSGTYNRHISAVLIIITIVLLLIIALVIIETILRHKTSLMKTACQSSHCLSLSQSVSLSLAATGRPGIFPSVTISPCHFPWLFSLSLNL